MKTKTPPPPPDLTALLARCHPNFQARIKRLAMVTGKDHLEVYALWRKYGETWTDQSKMLEEFIIWYAQDLNPTGTLDLRAAIA